jgi:hypothetical protein
MVDWDDNQKRKAFREALQEVYPTPANLAMFVDDELNENLAIVADGANLRETSYNLVKWAKANNRLDEVYAAFKKDRPNHSVIERLERQDFVPRHSSQTSKLAQSDWDSLFEQFLLDDLADLLRAFKKGFKEALGIEFRWVQLRQSPLIDLTQIRELLEFYDAHDKGTILAVRFVEFVIAELQRSNEAEERDLTPLEQWRDRIAQQFQVSPPAPPPDQQTGCHAYLLVALDVHGADVNVYPELHITGEAKPIPFGARPTTCSFHKVAEQLSEWIYQAEATPAVGDCDDGEVTLELFLPCNYLEEDIATTWKVKNKRGDEIALGTHRLFLVRSFERICDRQVQKALARSWLQLEGCVNARSQFHRQADFPEEQGALRALLKDLDVPGLKLVAQLPADAGKRRDLLNDIIDAAVPIALWSSETEHVDASTLETEFDTMLMAGRLTNFANLAKQWRIRRRASASAKSIKLLCDRPDRWPHLPDPDQESDLLVAS